MIETDMNVSSWLLAHDEPPMTARELAQQIGCSLPTVYRSLDRLVTQGYTLSRGTKRASKTGPLSTTYKIST